jgi:hypothetical protein
MDVRSQYSSALVVSLFYIRTKRIADTQMKISEKKEDLSTAPDYLDMISEEQELDPDESTG